MRSIGLPELIVMMGVFVMIPLVALVVVFLVRHIQAKERLRAIEKGVPVPAVLGDPWERAARTRQAGILWIAVGIGMVIFFGVLLGSASSTAGGAMLGLAFGAIPILIGVGLLVEYRLRLRDLKSRNAA